MSSLAGHAKITRAALAMLAADGRVAGSVLDPARVTARVLSRDILDLLTLGHWRDPAQCRHFMRRFDGQGGREAYDEAVAWIRSRAAGAARVLARHGAPSQALGDALHAVQDSFAPGHAEREAANGPFPGAIRRIRRYAGADKAGHAEGDAAWRGSGRTLRRRPPRGAGLVRPAAADRRGGCHRRRARP